MPDQHVPEVSPKILICDDELLFAQDLAMNLRDFGYHVTGQVSTGEEAVKSVEADRPDLVLMDINLAGEMDGIAAAKQIRGHADIPIVYITGYSEKSLMERAMDTEPYGYLVKPVGILEVRNAVEMSLYKHKADKRVKESELWVNALFDCLEEGVFMVTSDRIVKDCNPATERIFGYTREEMVGQSTEKLHTSVERYVEFGMKVSEALSSGTNAVMEYELKRKNGEVCPSEHTVCFLKTPSGETFGIASIVRDITDLKNAQAAFNESEEAFRSLYEHSLDGILLTEPSGKILKANRAACRIFGRTEDELCEAGSNALVDLTDPRLGPALEDRARTRSFRGRLNLRRKDGTIFPAEISSSVFTTRSGDLKSSMLVRDISEQERTEKELEKSRSELRTIYDCAPVMMCVLDGERRVLYANRALVEFLGESEESLKNGRACGVFGCINAQDDPRGCGYGHRCKTCPLKIAIEETYRTGLGHRSVEYRATLIREGTQREVVLLGSTALVESDDRSSVLLCLEDFSERKRLEEEKDKLVENLTDALAKVKKLSGLLPICASCKKIRDDNGYWTQIEAYIREHSEAEFSHGICPDCIEKFYPDFYEKESD